MKKKWTYLGLLILCIVGQFSVGITSQAEENPLGFTITPELPTTQIDETQPYFYLKTEPNKVQELKVKVTGTSDTPVKVKMYVANAITNEGGSVTYEAGKEKDPTLTQSMEEITKIEPSEIEVKKDEVKEVTLTITPPAQNYEGVKMGGIYFEQVTDKNSSGGAVKSAYSYRLGIVLSETEEEYKNGQTLELLAAKANLLRKEKTVQLTFQNPKPKAISKLGMTIKIINTSNNKVVKTQKLENGSMAPNSRFDFAVNWGIDAIPAGDYLAKVSATSLSQTWELEKKFTISKDEAKKLNDETLVKLSLPTWVKGVTVGLGALTIVLGICLSIREKKWRQEQKKKQKERKKKNTRRKKNEK